jgi:hypothetical protein
MVSNLTDTERAEFERICVEEPGSMRCWPVGGDWYQFTVGAQNQLVLGVVHRGTWLAANAPGVLN